MFKASHLPLLTEARIGTTIWRSPHVLAAPDTLPARILEVQNSHAITNLPAPHHFGTDLHNLASWFVGWDHRQLCWKLPLQNLQIGVAESSCINLDQEVMLATCRNGLLTELIWPVKLYAKVSNAFLSWR